MKELRCGCKKSRVQTILCDKHATQELESAARRLEDNPGRYYFQESLISRLSLQQEKEEEGED